MRCDCCPLSDPIDRNAAIEALRKLAEDCPGSTEAATAAAMGISVLSRLQSAWIDVEDRLPETDGVYLCIVGFKRNCGIYRPSEPHWVLRYYKSADSPHFELEGQMGMVITHWMPLPDAPEEGTE